MFAGGSSNVYQYCLNDPINKIDLTGLCDKKTKNKNNPQDEYKKSLQKEIELLRELLNKNLQYKQDDKNRQLIEKYLWHSPTFWEGADQAMPTLFDTMTALATITGSVPVAGGFQAASWLWTLKNTGLHEPVAVSTILTYVGRKGPEWYRISVSVLQILYDLFR